MSAVEQDKPLTAIAEYSPTAAALADLEHRYKGVVFDVTTRDGMATAIKGRAELRGYRVALEKKRVEIKAPALERTRLIDAEAKRLTAALSALEDPIDEAIQTEQTRKEREREERERAEAARIAAIQDNLARLTNAAGAYVGKPSAEIAAGLEKIRAHDVAGWAAEFLPVAQEAHAKAIAALEQLHAGALAQEKAKADEDARIKAEREELARLRAESEARAKEEQARAAEVARKQAEEAAAARAKIEAAERASRERIEAENRAARLAREEEERVAREARELNQSRMSEIQGIQQQVIIAQIGRAGVRSGGTIACIEETLAETEAWKIDESNFGAMTTAAQSTKDSAVAQIRGLLTAAKARAAEDAAQKSERERVEREARALAEQRQKDAEESRRIRDEQDAQQRKIELAQVELMDGNAMLAKFVERFGKRKEFAPVVRAINAYMQPGRKEAA